MATKQLENRLALLCDDCGTEIFADTNMIMLNDDLWKEVSDDVSDSYCDCCIEKRLDRPIEVEDFKPSTGMDFSGVGHIMCNLFWLKREHPDKFDKLAKSKA